MSQEDIEATKAPLMEHLIELRSRLIKALIAFFVAFIGCFIFAKHIYNVLIWPFVWIAGPEHSRFIYTALLEYFVTQIKLAMFGAATADLTMHKTLRVPADAAATNVPAMPCVLRWVSNMYSSLPSVAVTRVPTS